MTPSDPTLEDYAFLIIAAQERIAMLETALADCADRLELAQIAPDLVEHARDVLKDKSVAAKFKKLGS
jgi:hypothetical protein